MRKQLLIIIIAIAVLVPLLVLASHYAGERNGYILLQVEKNGEAWYVYPQDGERYYLGRPDDAFKIMRKLALGAKHDFIQENDIFPARLSGLILLDTESHGEAYYIYPGDLRKYYLGRPADAFRIMSSLGRGISDSGLVDIPVGSLDSAPPAPETNEKVLLSVPFTSQAPFGGWKDERQQDGCEEASALMAVRWARGQGLTKEDALKEILAASDYIKKQYGEYRDIAPQDTVDWIIKDYFNYEKARVIKDASLEDIISALEKGELVIAPMNGQMLHNPNYTPPGPPNHMLVIKGYDPEKKIFITNDPGTRLGESYQYSTSVLYSAIRAYPTGYHELIDRVRKDIIVVSK